MRYIAILNPAAGHGRAGSRRAAFDAALQRAGLACEVWTSETPRHAVALARRAATRADAVVAVGGDGTVLEVARGLIESRAPVPLGVVPLGTGNDFVKMIGMPLRLDAAVRALAHAVPRAVDYGRVSLREDDHPHTHLFVNAVGVGFDALVAIGVPDYKRLPGATGYLAAVVRALRRWDSPFVEVEGRDPDGGRRTLFEGPLLLVTAGNGVCSGGMFYLTPHASIEDGLLDVCLVREVTVTRILRLLPRVLRGRHEDAPEVNTARVRALTITAASGLPVHADGEILARRARTITIEIVPGGLPVLVPS